MSEVVLIVDDDPVQRRLLETTVQRFGYQAIVADGGDAAVKLLTRPDTPVDAIVLDLVMPDLDGLGVLAFMPTVSTSVPIWTFRMPLSGPATLLSGISCATRQKASRRRPRDSRPCSCVPVKKNLRFAVPTTAWRAAMIAPAFSRLTPESNGPGQCN